MEVYINHSGGLHKLKHKIEIPNDREKERLCSKIYMDTLCFFIVGNQPALMRSISHRDSKVFYLWIRVRINIKMGLSKKSDNPFR